MNANRDLQHLDIDQLAEKCADQTAKFFNREQHDPSYCYELFRRAIVGRNKYAWDKVFQQYQFLVANWVRRRAGDTATDEEIDYTVNRAFEKLWLALTPDKFDRFNDIASLLCYFQTCVNSVIVDHNRRNSPPTVSLEALAQPTGRDLASVEKTVTDQLERHRLWRTALDLMRDEKERFVLQASFAYDLKPSEIYASRPEQFESTAEVYRIKRNLLSRLRRNPVLQQFLSA
jgi:DNA-directed RNA polymerase specialized sigma24 family protein